MANADESPPADEEGDERADAEADQADAGTEAAEVLAAALEAEAAQAAAAFVPAAAGTLAKAPSRAIVYPDAEDDPDLVEDDFDEAEGQMNAFRATCLVV